MVVVVVVRGLSLHHAGWGQHRVCLHVPEPLLVLNLPKVQAMRGLASQLGVPSTASVTIATVGVGAIAATIAATAVAGGQTPHVK